MSQGHGKSNTYRELCNKFIGSGHVTSIQDVLSLAAANTGLAPATFVANTPVRVVVDGAQVWYVPIRSLPALLARMHFVRAKANRHGQGQLLAEDVMNSLGHLQRRVEEEEKLCDLLRATELSLMLECTGDRFPKYRLAKKPSHGDAGRVLERLSDYPTFKTDGQNSRTIGNKLVAAAFAGFGDMTGVLPELLQTIVSQPNQTTVYNCNHADAHFYSYGDFDGIEIVRTNDRDALLTLAYTPLPELGKVLVITEFRASTGKAAVADALFVKDAVVRWLLPQFVKATAPASLAFSKSLSAQPDESEQRLWVAGLFCMSQNGASDYGASLVHRGSGRNTQATAVKITDILAAFDKFLCNWQELSLENFRLSIAAQKSRLGGAASLSEDNGVSWRLYALRLAFAGEATLLLTRQMHGLKIWLAFLGVTLEQLTAWRESMSLLYPENLLERPAVYVRDDVFEQAAANFISSVFDLGVQRAKTLDGLTHAPPKAARPRDQVVAAPCVESKFSRGIQFVVPQPKEPIKFLKMDLSSDDSDFILDGSSDSERGKHPDQISDRQITALKADAAALTDEHVVEQLLLGKGDWPVAGEFPVLSDDEDAGPSRKKGHGKRAKPKAFGQGLEFSNNDGSAPKKKGPTLGYFVEELGSVAGLRFFRDDDDLRKSNLCSDDGNLVDTKNALRSADRVFVALQSEVSAYVRLMNALVDVTLEVAATVARDAQAVWPLLSNSFWISCVQAEFLLDVMPNNVNRAIRGVTMVDRKEEMRVFFQPEGGSGVGVLFNSAAVRESSLLALADVFRLAWQKVCGADPVARTFLTAIARSNGNTADSDLGNHIGSMIARSVKKNSRTLAVSILKSALIEDKCFGDGGAFDWTNRSVELFLCGIEKRSQVPADEDDAEGAAEDAAADLVKGDLVEFPSVTLRVSELVHCVRCCFDPDLQDDDEFDWCCYRDRAGQGVSMGSVCRMMNQLEDLFRATSGNAVWGGYVRTPVRQKLWRIGISSTELQFSPFFARLRESVGSVYQQPTWTDILRACSGSSFGLSSLAAGVWLVDGKSDSYARMHRILDSLVDENTQLVTDGVSLKLRTRRNLAEKERLTMGWKGAPAQVIGISRLCVAVDNQLTDRDINYSCFAELERVVEERRSLAKQPFSGVSSVFNLEEVWKMMEDRFDANGIVIRDEVANLLNSLNAPGDSLRKSRIFGCLPACIAARVLAPEVLDSLCVFSFDFGLCKWLGGGVVLPTDPATGDRTFQPFHVRGGEYHHRTGFNKCQSKRAKQGKEAPFDFEAKLRRALECGKTRLFQEVLRDMRGIADRVNGGRDFIVLVGDGGIGSGRSHRKPATKEFLKFLQEFVLVVQIPERNTSKLCPRCWSESAFFWDIHKPQKTFHRTEIRTKWCTSDHCCSAGGGAGFAYDRDTAAAVSFFNIFYSMVQGWGRPAAFQRSNGAFKLSPGVLSH